MLFLDHIKTLVAISVLSFIVVGCGRSDSNSDINLTVSEGPGLVRLMWEHPGPNHGASGGYAVYENGSELDSPYTTGYSVGTGGGWWISAGLDPNLEYCYQIREYLGGCNWGDESKVVCAQPMIDDVSPTRPEIFSTTGKSNSVTIVLESTNYGLNEKNADIAEYEVFRDGVLVGTIPRHALSLSFEDTNVVADVNYCYTVSATDVMGNVSELSEMGC